MFFSSSPVATIVSSLQLLIINVAGTITTILGGSYFFGHFVWFYYLLVLDLDLL